MGADLGHAAILKNENPVGIHQGIDAVGDQNDGGIVRILPQGGTDACIGGQVDGRQ